MTVDKINNHDERLLELEISQFKGRENSEQILRIIAEEIQEVENVLFSLIIDRWLDTATGAQLDVLGKIAGLPRLNRDDDEYRAAIKTQLAINRGGGEVDTILDAILFFTGAQDAKVTEVFPASIQVDVEQPVVSGQFIAQLIRRIKAGGVGLLAVVESGNYLGNEDLTVADETERLGLGFDEVEAGDIVFQQDTSDMWEFQGGDPSDPGNWVLVGPPFVFSGDDDGLGFADINESPDFPQSGILSNLVSQ